MFRTVWVIITLTFIWLCVSVRSVLQCERKHLKVHKWLQLILTTFWKVSIDFIFFFHTESEWFLQRVTLFFSRWGLKSRKSDTKLCCYFYMMLCNCRLFPLNYLRRNGRLGLKVIAKVKLGKHNLSTHCLCYHPAYVIFSSCIRFIHGSLRVNLNRFNFVCTGQPRLSLETWEWNGIRNEMKPTTPGLHNGGDMRRIQKFMYS